MYKLNFKKRVWIVKQVLADVSVNKIALSQGVSHISVFKIMQKCRSKGWDRLRDHKTGRSEVVLNLNTEIIIIDLRNRFRWGAVRIKQKRSSTRKHTIQKNTKQTRNKTLPSKSKQTTNKRKSKKILSNIQRRIPNRNIQQY